LTGDSRSPYLRRAAAALRAAGLRVACYNPRGRGGNALRSPFMYAAGYTGDLRRVVAHIRARYPCAPIVGVGYSLGGVYLAKLLAEDGPHSQMAGAATLASPIHIDKMARHLTSTWLGHLIDRFVIAPSVRDTLAPYVEAPGATGDLEAARSSRTLDRIDQGVLAPMMGCQSKEQYYEESTPSLNDVRVPLLLLQAENDPIKPYGLQQALEAATRDSGAPLVLAVTPEGGHSLTWPEGWRAEASWGERVVVEWARACGERAAGTAASQ
jgi:predicted alpha/beta-fold hydrolase